MMGRRCRSAPRQRIGAADGMLATALSIGVALAAVAFAFMQTLSLWPSSPRQLLQPELP